MLKNYTIKEILLDTLKYTLILIFLPAILILLAVGKS